MVAIVRNLRRIDDLVYFVGVEMLLSSPFTFFELKSAPEKLKLYVGIDVDNRERIHLKPSM